MYVPILASDGILRFVQVLPPCCVWILISKNYSRFCLPTTTSHDRHRKNGSEPTIPLYLYHVSVTVTDCCQSANRATRVSFETPRLLRFVSAPKLSHADCIVEKLNDSPWQSRRRLWMKTIGPWSSPLSPPSIQRSGSTRNILSELRLTCLSFQHRPCECASPMDQRISKPL